MGRPKTKTENGKTKEPKPDGPRTGKTARKPKQTLKKEQNKDTIERTLNDKYPGKIVHGTWQPAGTSTKHGKKATIEIKCADCTKTRRIATSDLHQVSRCEEHAKTHYRSTRKGKPKKKTKTKTE